MTIKFYINYLKKTHVMLKQLAKENEGGICLIFSLWSDYIWVALRHGCLIRQYVYGDFWRLRGFDRKRALTYRRICKIFRICNNPDYIHILESKRDFNRFYSQFVKRDWLYISDAGYDEFRCFMLRHDAVIIKPLELCEGEGIFRVDNVKTDKDIQALYDKLKGGKYILEECIVQHEALNFGGRSVNTIKIDTLLKKDGSVFVFKPALRVGVGDAVVDNYGSGGCVYDVDLDHGIVMCPSFSKDNVKHIVHPGSSIQMVGYKIPNWDKVIACVTEAAKMLPQCRFIGWDVAITSNGVDLIEGNHNLDYELMEFQGIHRGWWHKLKKFF